VGLFDGFRQILGRLNEEQRKNRPQLTKTTLVVLEELDLALPTRPFLVARVAQPRRTRVPVCAHGAPNNAQVRRRSADG
jgi:hypothetical protein